MATKLRIVASSPAKLILFGEHTILHGSAAYAVPLPSFSCTLATAKQATDNLFTRWYLDACKRPGLEGYLNFNRWKTELSRLSVDSSIPVGYGLGSSGALCSELLRRYPGADLSAVSTSTLRTVLGQLESYFHGSSSGLDPLVSYLERHICVAADGSLTVLSADRPLPCPPGFHWFLLDSGQPRRGATAITTFRQLVGMSGWQKSVLQPMTSRVNALIAACNRQNYTSFTQDFRTLSELQLTELSPLIPDHVRQQWQLWLAQDAAYLKLCGAGGGGYFLGLSRSNYLPDVAATAVRWLS